MSTIPTLNISYGESVSTTSEEYLLPVGVTVASYAMIADGTTTTSPIRLVDDLSSISSTPNFLPITNGVDQTITVPTFRNRGTFDLSIIPDGISGGTLLLAAIYASLIAHNVNTSITLNGVTIGSTDFITNPDVLWYYTGAGTLLSPYVISNPPTSSTSAVGSFSLRLTVTIPSGSIIRSNIVLPVGSITPEAGVLTDECGRIVDFSKLPNVASTSSGVSTFIVPFSLKGFTLTSDLASHNVIFPAGSSIPLGTTLSFSAIGVPTPSAGNIGFAGTGNAVDNLLSSVSFPIDTTFSQSLTITPGSTVGGGAILPTGTSFGVSSFTPITFGRTVIYRNYTLLTGSSLANVNPTDQPINIPAGSQTTNAQLVPHGFSIHEYLNLPSGTVFGSTAVSYTLEGDLENKCPLTTTSSISLEEGSIISAGSSLPIGSSSIENLIATSAVTIPSGTVFADKFTLPFAITITAVTSAATATNLQVGMKLKSGTSFGTGTLLPTGFTLPGSLKLDYTSTAFLAAGMTIPAGSKFYSKFNLYGSTQFKAHTIFQKGYIFPSGTEFPEGTTFGSGSVFSFPFRVPQGSKFCAGYSLPIGFTFEPGAAIPSSVDFIANDSTNSSGVNIFNSITITPVGGSATVYYQIPSSSAFLVGKIIPAGTILSYSSGGTTTNSNTISTTGSWAGVSTETITLQQGDYEYEDGSPGQSVFTISVAQDSTGAAVAAAATSLPIKLLAGVNLPTDILVPAAYFDSPFSHLSLSSPLVLQVATTLLQDYCVHSLGPVLWPADISIPAQWSISGTLITTAAFMNTKNITLPGCIYNGGYFDSIIPSTGTLVFPQSSTTVLNTPIILGATIGIAAANTAGSSTVPVSYASMAYLELVTETTLELAPGALTPFTPTNVTLTSTTAPLVACHDFVLSVSVSIYSSLSLLAGTVFPVGSYALTSITIPAGIPLPGGFTLANAVTVARSFIAGDSSDGPVTLLTGTVLNSGSIIKRGSIFPNGLTLMSEAYLGRIASLQVPFTIPAGAKFQLSVKYPQFVGDSPFYYVSS